MSARQETSLELDTVTKQRLLLAGQISAGVASVPGNWTGRTPEATIARAGWDIAGKLIALAYSGGF